jgi:NTE family protein
MPAATDPPRLGLALSGGGFRASYFHLGVLARLAELDLLRHVEAVSTVSGGSVIGAAYYLKLRTLLQGKRDDEIEPGDYVRIVRELIELFHAGVQRNPRGRAFADAGKVWKMRRARYSRSDRMAELYDSCFFNECAGQKRINLLQTRIQPPDEASGFDPLAVHPHGGTYNTHREHKVPVLMINSTTLNTGHNFRFTGTWMGERSSTQDRIQIDGNALLEHFHPLQDDVPDKYRRVPLSIAVAASTAVPGVFHPLALTELYRKPTVPWRKAWVPQLVDGGVHDNQGTEALLDLGCNLVVASDASGQLRDEPSQSTAVLSVLNRTTSVLSDRIREEEFESARARLRPRPLVFMHLRHGLRRPKLRPGDAACEIPRDDGPRCVDARVQRLLAGVRTDLDAFSDVEAHALMADGYAIADESLHEVALKELHDTLGAEARRHGLASKPPPGPQEWPFDRIAAFLAEPSDALIGQLAEAGKSFTRGLRRNRALQLGLAGGALALAAALAAGFAFMPVGMGWVLFGLLFGGVLLAGAVPLRPALAVGRWLALALSFLLIPVARFQLRWVDPVFLSQGRVDALGPPPGQAPPAQSSRSQSRRGG